MRYHIMNHIVKAGFLIITGLILVGCASQPANLPATALVNENALPAVSPELDHYIAWVPLEQAQTAAVAEAMTHISLRQAREETSREVCRGNPVSGGNVIERHGPVAARTPASMGGHPAWYYRISQQPGTQDCLTVEQVNLYQALQGRLPDWLSIRRGRPATVRTLGLRSDP